MDLLWVSGPTRKFSMGDGHDLSALS